MKTFDFDLQLFAPFNILEPFYSQSSRYRRRAKEAATAMAIDKTVTPAFVGLTAPGAPTLTASTTGGTLATQTAAYRISALNPNGETLAGTEATVAVTGPTGSVGLSWTPIPNAYSYNVYGRTAGVEMLIANVTGTTYTDTGAVTPSGALPLVNSTQVIAGAVAGQIRAGDSLYRTANSGVAAMWNPAANGGSYVGEAEDSYPMRLGLDPGLTLGDPANAPYPSYVGVRRSGEFIKKTTLGDVFAPGAFVYVGLDPQTVTVVPPLALLAPPSGLALTPATTGGTLAAGTYGYRITGVNAAGETVPGPEVTCSVTGSTGSVGLAWNLLTGASSYRIYGRTAGAEQLLATVSTNSYTDTGAAVAAGLPPTSNTTQSAPIGRVSDDQNPSTPLGTATWGTTITGAAAAVIGGPNVEVIIEIQPVAAYS